MGSGLIYARNVGKYGGGAMPDMINHPPHYEVGKYEAIDVMQEIFGREAVMHFCECNAFKYIWRM